MDIVITYVNGLDPAWQKDYADFIGAKTLTKRYRDWGTLPYLFRGIEQCMPFVEHVFLVVARESQVPDWINREQVKVVLHEDIIPREFLPMFNSSSIEMFLHRIEGLGEQYLYFNDDFFPILPSKPEDFFREGKMAADMARHIFTFGSLFRIFVKGSDRMARQAAGLSKSLVYLRPQHTCAPMLKSVCDELYNKCQKEIHDSVTPLRETHNYNQYLFTDYAYFTGHTFQQRISNQHISLSVATTSKLRKAILTPKRNIVCINDVEMSEEKFQRFHQTMHEAFETRFPHKSKFEV